MMKEHRTGDQVRDFLSYQACPVLLLIGSCWMRQAAKDIDEGRGRRHLCHDAVLFEVWQPRLGTVYIDKKRQRAYDSLCHDSFRGLLTLPRYVWSHAQHWPQDIVLPPSSEWYRLLFRHFETTKLGGRGGFRHMENADLFVCEIACHLRKKLYLQFLEKLHSWRGQGRLLVCFHGTKIANKAKIIEDNFAMSKVGTNTGNPGYYGRGIYFGRRAQTALGYNEGTELLCCLVAVKDVFTTPPPDNCQNPYYGRACKKGYDAHLSPSARELVIFNTRQILPCFTLHLSRHTHDSSQ